MFIPLFQIPIGYFILFFLILYLGALTLPYIRHKKVSPSFQKEYKNRDFYNLTTGTEQISYVDDNHLALLYRLRMIEEAEKEIILSTFDFNSDNAGKDIISALIHAAERGVHVQIIVDGISGFSDMKCNPWFQALASIESVSIKIYNPVNILKPWKLQARLHDKYLIIDHKMYLLGGRNTSDLFLGDYSDNKNIDQELFVYETQNDIDI